MAVFAPTLQNFGPPGAPGESIESAEDVPNFCRLPAKTALFAEDVPFLGTSSAFHRLAAIRHPPLLYPEMKSSNRFTIFEI